MASRLRSCITSALLALGLGSCSAVVTAEHFAPIEAEGLALAGFSSTGPAGAVAGLSLRLGGEPEGLLVEAGEVVFRISSSRADHSLWSFGPILPVIPAFGIGDESGRALDLTLHLVDAPLDTHFAPVRIVTARLGQTAEHAPTTDSTGWFVVQRPPREDRVVIGDGDPGPRLHYEYSLTQDELAELPGFDAWIEWEGPDGTRDMVRIRFTRASTTSIVWVG